MTIFPLQYTRQC